MTVVYIDSVFLLNTLMDYFVLVGAGRLTGTALLRRRCALGAVLGGAYAVAVFLPGMSFLADPLVKLAAVVLMTLASFGGEKRFLRLLLVVLGISCGLAGAVLLLGMASGGVPMAGGVFYTDVSPRVLLIAATAAYGVLTVVFRASAARGMQGRLLSVRVSLMGRTAELTALLDTGNGLREPGTGKAILILDPDGLRTVLPAELRPLLCAARLREPVKTLEQLSHAAPRLRPALCPYHAVGTENGLLLTIRSDCVCIEGVSYPGMLLGLSPTTLGDGYRALWGGEMKGEQHGDNQAQSAADSGPYGPAAGRGNPLHRRQRYPSVSTGQGEGGGAAECAGQGGGQAGAD